MSLDRADCGAVLMIVTLPRWVATNRGMPQYERTSWLPWLQWSAAVLCVVSIAAFVVAMVFVLRVIPQRFKRVTVAPAASRVPSDACNPACNEMREACVHEPGQEAPQCVSLCPALRTNVPLNTYCLLGEAVQGCLTRVPEGRSAAFVLQSARLAEDGRTTLALTAVPSSDPARLPPTFELRPAQLEKIGRAHV